MIYILHEYVSYAYGSCDIAAVVALLLLMFVAVFMTMLALKHGGGPAVAIGCIASVLFLIGAIVLACTPSVPYRYVEALLEPDVTYTAIDERYEVLEKRGIIYVLKEKEPLDATQAETPENTMVEPAQQAMEV